MRRLTFEQSCRMMEGRTIDGLMLRDRINQAIEKGIIDNNEFQEYEILIGLENG